MLRRVVDLQWVDLMYRYARLPLHCFPHGAGRGAIPTDDGAARDLATT
jgi:hypothetical protein